MDLPGSSNTPAGGYYYLPDGGFLRLHGEDRRAFLQRQTTNNIDLLKPDRSVLTVLTTPTARILDVLILIDEGDAIGVLTLPGRGSSTGAHLRKRIFFNDRVSLQDESAGYVQVDIFGRRAQAALERLGLPALPQTNECLTGQHGLRCIGIEATFGLGWRLFAPRDAQWTIEKVSVEAGLSACTTGVMRMLRIQSGLPSEHAELTEDYTPLEVGLAAAVSDSKGCYTGQEVIARQLTYDKVTRLLCGLKLSGVVNPGTQLFTPDREPAGRLTSFAESPHLGSIGLGVIRKPYTAPGSELHAAGAAAQDIIIQVAALPIA